MVVDWLKQAGGVAFVRAQRVCGSVRQHARARRQGRRARVCGPGGAVRTGRGVRVLVRARRRAHDRAHRRGRQSRRGGRPRPSRHLFRRVPAAGAAFERHHVFVHYEFVSACTVELLLRGQRWVEHYDDLRAADLAPWRASSWAWARGSSNPRASANQGI